MGNKSIKRNYKIFLILNVFLFLANCASLKKIKERDQLVYEKKELIVVMNQFGVWDKKHQKSIICNEHDTKELIDYRKKRDELLRKGISLSGSLQVKKQKEDLILFMREEEKKEEQCLKAL